MGAAGRQSVSSEGNDGGTRRRQALTDQISGPLSCSAGRHPTAHARDGFL